MVTNNLTRPLPTLSAKDFHADPAQPSATGTQTTPQTAGQRLQTAFAIQGGEYKVGPVNAGPAIAGVFFIVALMFALRLIIDGGHEVTKRDKTRFHEVDVTLWNCFFIGVMAIPGIVLAKFLSVRFLHPQNPVRVISQMV